MEEHKRICPQCKGVGMLPPKRQRTYSSDPTKKWCNLCKNFLDRKEFYAGGGYCKKCQCSRVRPIRRKCLKKHDKICPICAVKYMGSKKQIYCTRKCNCEAMTRNKSYRSYNFLSNDQIDQISKE